MVLTFLMKGEKAPRVAHRAQRVSVVLNPNPQISLPTMGIWKIDANPRLPAIEKRYCSQVDRLSPSHLPA